MIKNYKIVERLKADQHVSSLDGMIREALELAREEFATVATFSDMTTEKNWIDMKGTINSRANQSFARMNSILSKLKETNNE